MPSCAGRLTPVAAFATCVAYGSLVFGIWKKFGMISPALKAGSILVCVDLSER